jgi:hypothetical protein
MRASCGAGHRSRGYNRRLSVRGRYGFMAVNGSSAGPDNDHSPMIARTPSIRRVAMGEMTCSTLPVSHQPMVRLARVDTFMYRRVRAFSSRFTEHARALLW